MNLDQWLELERAARRDHAAALVWADALEDAGRVEAATLARLTTLTFTHPNPGPCFWGLQAVHELVNTPVVRLTLDGCEATCDRYADLRYGSWYVQTSRRNGGGRILQARFFGKGFLTPTFLVRPGGDHWMNDGSFWSSVDGLLDPQQLRDWLLSAWETLVPLLPPPGVFDPSRFGCESHQPAAITLRGGPL